MVKLELIPILYVAHKVYNNNLLLLKINNKLDFSNMLGAIYKYIIS